MSVSRKEGNRIITAFPLILKSLPFPTFFFFLLDKKEKKNQDDETFSLKIGVKL